MEHKQHIEYFEHWAGKPPKLILVEKVEDMYPPLTKEELEENIKMREKIREELKYD